MITNSIRNAAGAPQLLPSAQDAPEPEIQIKDDGLHELLNHLWLEQLDHRRGRQWREFVDGKDHGLSQWCQTHKGKSELLDFSC